MLKDAGLQNMINVHAIARNRITVKVFRRGLMMERKKKNNKPLLFLLMIVKRKGEMMKGIFPTKLSLNLEIAENGQKKLIFREWHERLSDDYFEKVNEQTKLNANAIMEQYAPLGLDVKYTVYPTEKSYEVTYSGQNIRPAVGAIFGELMPLLVTNDKEAMQTINLMVQLVNFCLKLEITVP